MKPKGQQRSAQAASLLGRKPAIKKGTMRRGKDRENGKWLRAEVAYRAYVSRTDTEVFGKRKYNEERKVGGRDAGTAGTAGSWNAHQSPN